MFGLAYVVSMATCVGLPLMLYIQQDVALFQMFVPLTGRSGSCVPPDVVIGLLACLCVCTGTPHTVSVWGCVLICICTSMKITFDLLHLHCHVLPPFSEALIA